MRTFTRQLLLYVAICSTLLAGCENSPVDDKPDGELGVTIESTTLTIDGNGGTYDVGYTIQNGINGIDIVAEADVPWIDNFRTEHSRLYFDCEKNLTNKERIAKIAVRYPSLSTQLITITQAAGDTFTFDIEICDVKTTSCSTKLYPSDVQTPYIVSMSEMDYLLAAGITDEQKLFKDDYDTIMQLAQEYGITRIEEFMFMNAFCFKDYSYITWEGMVPDKEYVLYAYAIEFNEDGTDYTLASAVTHEIIVLPANAFTDIEFDVEVTIDGPKATYNFTPLNWDGKYYINIYAEGDYMYLAEGETPDEAYSKQVANNWISMIETSLMSGYTAEQLIELMCLQGPDSYTEVRDSDTAYCMVFYGIEMIDGIPQVATHPYIVNFRTEPVQPSDMQIDIKVENCYVRVADMTITPSNNDESYVATFLKKSDLPYDDNQEIIDWLLSYQLNSYTGVIQSHIVSLEPDTEYIALAFGYYGGVVTTDLFRYEFKTEPEGECSNNVVDVTITAPYSLVDLETAMPDQFYQYGMFESLGWYAMCAEIETAQPEGDVFMMIYDAELIVTNGLDSLEADLRSSLPSDRTTLFVGEDEKLYVMCAITMDYKGNMSEMWVSEPFSYTYSTDTKRDINELLDKLGLTPEVQAEPTIKMLNL